jgi:hypothetical protein
MSNRLLLGVGPSPDTGGGFVGDNLLLEDGYNFLLEDGDQLYLENEAFDPVYDSDAQAYMTAVENADGQELESGVKEAINTFVLGCKSDGIWDAIKASCILAGARTLSGAIQPLVGTAPTNYNFVGGDYNRKTGLVGDGATKYLDSNRNNNADPQDDKHMSVYVTYIGAVTGKPFLMAGGRNHILRRSTGTYLFRNNALTLYDTGTQFQVGFAGNSRSSSSSFNVRANSVDYVASITSDSLESANYEILRTGANYGDGRLSFYSIGEALDLALLDSRVSTLISQIGAAIP